MIYLDRFTPAMSDALRAFAAGAVTAGDAGATWNAVQELCKGGFLRAERTSHQTYYEPTAMGFGALAVLNSPPLPPQENETEIAHIQRVVANYYSIPVSEMVSARRSREIARPRQIAMYLCRERTPLSLPSIARRFGNRDHTTILHGIRKIETLQRDDEILADDIESLRRTLDPDWSDPDFDYPPDRTPCVKCGTRADIGCVHTRVAA